MKKILFSQFAALVAGILFLATSAAEAITIGFSNVTDSRITFTGATDTFEFTDGVGGWDFGITNSNGVGDSVNLMGNIGGTFKIGAITTVGPAQNATVTTVGSPGTFSIFDGTTWFNSEVSWISIYTLGSVGGLNAGGSLNLSNVSYAGTNADLLALASANNRTASISFQFLPARTLNQLVSDTMDQTSYSGTINGSTPSHVPDGGSVLALLGMGLLGIQGCRRWFKSSRS